MILRDEFSANEIAFMVTDMFNSAEEAQVKWWSKMKASQLTSIYKKATEVQKGGSSDLVNKVNTYSFIYTKLVTEK